MPQHFSLLALVTLPCNGDGTFSMLSSSCQGCLEPTGEQASACQVSLSNPTLKLMAAKWVQQAMAK
jgi:hypothetical protein